MKTLRQDSIRLRFRLSPRHLRAFHTYLDELQRARPRLRLTALTDREAVQRRHFLEPLALLSALERLGVLGADVIDIGSGAGFPGLPIQIVRPELRIPLLEANGRRAAFLERLVQRLGLEHVTVVNRRAEEAARDSAHREAYDLALARAVAPLPVLVELALPFLRVGGALAAPKGSATRREIAEAASALAACGGAVEYVGEQEVPETKTPPTLVVIRKESPTPARFPRRPGIPAKHPLR